MRTKHGALILRGKSGMYYSFPVEGTPENFADWEREEFEIDRVFYRIPAIVVDLHLGRLWMLVTDVIHFRWGNIKDTLRNTP